MGPAADANIAVIDEDEREGLRPGQTVADERFVLGNLLGRGGLALVFEAYDRQHNHVVALKILRQRYVDRPEREERLRREFEYAQRVDHPSLVEVYEEGRFDGGRPFFSMERIQGRTLSSVISGEGRLPVERLVGIAHALAEALEALHQQGIVHRDVKPANVLVLDDDRIKLLDLGMAGDVNAPAVPAGHGARLTRVHDLLGTHEYMAPEQVSKVPPHRAMDVFALGVVVYEMLAGITPYSGMKVREYVELQLHGDPHARSAQRWSRLRGAPEELAQLVDQCRARAPAQRPGSMREIVERLDRIAGQLSALRLPVLVAPRAMAPMWREPETCTALAPIPAPVFSDRVPNSVARHPVRTRLPIGRSILVAAPLVALTVWVFGGSHAFPESAESEPEPVEARVARAKPPRGPVEPVTAPMVTVPSVQVEPRGNPAPSTPPASTGAELNEPAPEDRCVGLRRRARTASTRRRWSTLVRLTAHSECWEESTERIRLRVEAIAQLKRWQACIETGRGSQDRVIAQWVDLCRYYVRFPRSEP